MRLTRPGLGKGFGPLGPSLYKEFRVYMERDPIVLFSCIIGLFGFVAPFVVGDGGRKAEDNATNYAFRIKHLYPPKGSSD